MINFFTLVRFFCSYLSWRFRCPWRRWRPSRRWHLPPRRTRCWRRWWSRQSCFVFASPCAASSARWPTGWPSPASLLCKKQTRNAFISGEQIINFMNNTVSSTAGESERRCIVLPDCRNPTPYITSRHAPHRGGGGGWMPERELAHSIVGLPECGLSTPPTNCYLRRGNREL